MIEDFIHSVFTKYKTFTILMLEKGLEHMYSPFLLKKTFDFVYLCSIYIDKTFLLFFTP